MSSEAGTPVSPVGSVTVRFSREVLKRNEQGGERSRRRGDLRSSERQDETVANALVVEVYPSETVRELCERCLVNPFEKDLPEVSWANTNLPLSERLTHINATKPWQLNLAKGEDELLMTVPAGVAIRSKPLRSRRATSGAESDEAALRSRYDPSSDADEKQGAKVRKLGQENATADETERPATGSGSPYEGNEGGKRDVTNRETISEEQMAEAAAKARAAEAAAAASARDDVDDLAEHAAAGLMAVAAGLPVQKKRGRGRPRKIPVQEPSRAMRDVPPGLRGGGFPGSVAGEVNALSPALLAAYEAGRADAAAAVISATAGLAASPVSVSARAGANPPSVADIIDKFYTHRPSTTAEKAFPLDSFRAAAGNGLASGSGGRGPTAAGGFAANTPAASFKAGSAANDKALWQWNQTIAMLSGQAGHPAGAFVDLSSPYASMFAPPSTAAELRRVAEANERWLSEVSSSMEEVKMVAAAVAEFEGETVDPSKRAAFVARVEKVLRKVDEKKSQIPVSQRVEIAKSVLALRAWVKKQLQARITELSARAWEPKPEQLALEKEKGDPSKDKGKALAASQETPAFSLLATVAAASDGKRGAFAISSDSDPTEG